MKPQISTRTLVLALSGVFLASTGCSSYDQPRAALDIRPVASIKHGAGRSEALYAVGRYYQGQIRYDKAIESYQKLIAEDPAHAEAHNALAVIYSQQGRHELAEIEFKAAAAAAPAAAHIHSNLGYEYLRQGRLDEAMVALREAMRLDPANRRAAGNLAEARVRLAADQRRDDPAPPALVQVVVVEAAAVIAAVPLAASAPAPDAAPGMRLVEVAPQTYELQRPESRIEPSLPRPEAFREQKPARLEVANGNGVGGLARRAAALLQSAGYGHARLTNQKPYRLQVTEIQYRPGFEHQAQRLNRIFAGTGILAPATALRKDIEVRVVLGRNLRSTTQMAELEVGLAQLAAADAGSAIR